MDSTKHPSIAPDCPFLGLKNDPGTSLAYATTANHCFHCHTPTIPTLEHQENYCLTKKFAECSVYQQPEKKAFPKQLRQAVKRAPDQRKPWLIVGWTIGLIVASLLGWQGFITYQTSQIAAGLNTQATVAASKPTTTPTPLPSPTQTPTEMPATQTPIPTATSIPPQKHALEVPIEVDGKQFVIHMVIVGEQMVFLARDYKTSIEAIQAINIDLLNTIWSGSAVVISPGLQSPDPGLPTFRPYKVTDTEIKIEALAEKLGVDASLFTHYNRCEPGCLLKSGDWVIVPFSK